jgi:hypothetical protein
MGRSFEVPAEQTGTATSPHTGRELRLLRTELTCTADEAEVIHDLLDARPLDDEEGVSWEGRVPTESYSNGGPHTLVITWVEQEGAPSADSVEFEGLTLRPTRYEEHDWDGTIAITLEATHMADEAELLRGLEAARHDESGRYWPVIRHGVSEEPRRMRLGRVLWQQNGDQIDHQITLVDEAYDARDNASSWVGMHGEPELGHVIDLASSLTGQLDALLRELEAAGTLEAEALERIREAVLKLRAELAAAEDHAMSSANSLLSPGAVSPSGSGSAPRPRQAGLRLSTCPKARALSFSCEA